MGKSGFFEFHEQVRARRPAAGPPGQTLPGIAGNAASSPAAGPTPISVSELTHRIERVLRNGVPETIHVRGEISNFRPQQSSGHVYFTLKDAGSCVDCVMWGSDAARMKFKPADGMELLATGKVTVYVARGKYQLSVTTLRPLGKGALELAFQQLRAKLEEQGFFAAERKLPLPQYPMTVALVTGADTAALQDILKVLRRFAWIRLLLYPVPVQGQGAAQRIAAALMHLSQRGAEIGVQVILLARGGGSLEDLWAFNEEVVARAIADSSLPIVTGIGHEVDTTIADLVADYHAHTPTEAAQIIAAPWRVARDRIDTSTIRLRRSAQTLLQQARLRLANIERHETFRRPLERINALGQLLDDRQRGLTLALTTRLHNAQWRVQQYSARLERNMPARIGRMREQLDRLSQRLTTTLSARLRSAGDRLSRAQSALNDHHPKFALPLHRQRLDASSQRLARAARADLAFRQQQLDALARQLQAVGPENVLRRGYTITTRKNGDGILRSSAQVKAGDRLITRFADGEVESTADDPKQPRLF
ncbi:MAG TPA: exodeoxyribonuclease VII large subunit [Tepidisphaeraceae bacterium]|jgi:exodeoxyribonuclease VII large subunit|nr:exodeoxyribonuclease VII large subunit [Tepidisphaeraceae bacterium]